MSSKLAEVVNHKGSKADSFSYICSQCFCSQSCIELHMIEGILSHGQGDKKRLWPDCRMHLKPVGRLCGSSGAEEGGQCGAQLRGNLCVRLRVQGIKQAAFHPLRQNGCWVPLCQVSQCQRCRPAHAMRTSQGISACLASRASSRRPWTSSTRQWVGQLLTRHLIVKAALVHGQACILQRCVQHASPSDHGLPPGAESTLSTLSRVDILSSNSNHQGCG